MPSSDYGDQGIGGGDDNQLADPQEPHDGDKEEDDDNNNKGSSVRETGPDGVDHTPKQPTQADIRQGMMMMMMIQVQSGSHGSNTFQKNDSSFRCKHLQDQRTPFGDLVYLFYLRTLVFLAL